MNRVLLRILHFKEVLIAWVGPKMPLTLSLRMTKTKKVLTEEPKKEKAQRGYWKDK